MFLCIRRFAATFTLLTCTVCAAFEPPTPRPLIAFSESMSNVAVVGMSAKEESASAILVVAHIPTTSRRHALELYFSFTEKDVRFRQPLVTTAVTAFTESPFQEISRRTLPYFPAQMIPLDSTRGFAMVDMHGDNSGVLQNKSPAIYTTDMKGRVRVEVMYKDILEACKPTRLNYGEGDGYRPWFASCWSDSGRIFISAQSSGCLLPSTKAEISLYPAITTVEIDSASGRVTPADAGRIVSSYHSAAACDKVLRMMACDSAAFDLVQCLPSDSTVAAERVVLRILKNEKLNTDEQAAAEEDVRHVLREPVTSVVRRYILLRLDRAVAGSTLCDMAIEFSMGGQFPSELLGPLLRERDACVKRLEMILADSSNEEVRRAASSVLGNLRSVR